ncbi:15802_t:CDS:2 [Funneliformis geosporum]|nr:15802_t:CDS:2 [Funneliformis geosporum]
MTLLENEPRNLENEFLLGLTNQTVIADVFAQIRGKSKILPKIKIVQVDGDHFKIVGLKSNEPKIFSWNYKEQEFGPSEAANYTGRITEKDKLIFFTVFSESIETLALGNKAPVAVAEQAEQLSSKVANFYDKEFALNYVSDSKRYHEEAIIELTPTQLQDVQLVTKILITAGFQMTTPSKKFNLQEDECNVEDTKKLFCFLNYPFYSSLITSSLHTSPSPILATLEKHFEVIPINMANGIQAALIDSDGIFLAQVMVDFRPAFAIKCNDSLEGISDLLKNLGSKKDLLKDFSKLSDTKSSKMTEKQAKE